MTFSAHWFRQADPSRAQAWQVQSAKIVACIIGLLETRIFPPGVVIENLIPELQRVMATPPNTSITGWKSYYLQRNEKPSIWILTVPGYRIRFQIGTLHSVDCLPQSVCFSPEEGGALYAAEMNAQTILSELLSMAQWQQYQINGTFTETSPTNRSLVYLFRRGFPLLVYDVGSGYFRFRVGLCLHAQGYKSFTWRGDLCPTDDIIALLLLVRTNEHTLWKKANHLSEDSPMLGI